MFHLIRYNLLVKLKNFSSTSCKMIISFYRQEIKRINEET